MNSLNQPQSNAATLGWVLAAAILLLALLRLVPGGLIYLQADRPELYSLASIELWTLSLPRILTACLAGAALGLAGNLFQALTRNALASPDLLAVTGGCQLGLILCLLLSVSPMLMPLVLMLAGLGGAGLAILTAGGFQAPTLHLLLSGSACALLFAALSTLCLALFEQKLEGIALWNLGVLYQPGAEGLLKVLPWLLVLALLPWLIRPLQILQLGDDNARLLGLSLSRTRSLSLLIASLLIAVAVTLAGPIGFIGLLAPNLVRSLNQHRLPQQWLLSALTGGLLLLASDSLVLLLQLDSLLSAGIMLALIGTPLLLWLIFHNRQWLAHGESPAEAHRRLTGPGVWLLLISLLLLAALLLSALSGLKTLSLQQAWAGWFKPLAADRLLLDLRLPRALVAAMGGALLATSGVLLQSLTRNPLAGPDLLGISQSCALGALAVLIVWPHASATLLFAASLTGGLLLLALLVGLTRKHHFSPLPVSLSGMILGALAMALCSWLIAEFSVQPAQSLVWLVGSTYGRSWADVWALCPWLLLLFVALPLAQPLDLLQLGEQNAQSLGVNLSRIRLQALALACLLTAATVAVIGPVAFVGLLTPHLVQRLGFYRHQVRLPAAMLCGALLLVLADYLSRSLLAPTEIPVGVLTAALGAPYLLWLMRSHRSPAR